MFRSTPRGTHRAAGPAVIDYRGLVAPVSRGVGGAAVLSAVTATAVLQGAEASHALTPAPTVVGQNSAAAPAVAPASPYTGVKLRLGARGDAVTYLQKQLNANGQSLTVDGVFGSRTLAAVRAEQSDAGIGVDGVVGPKTWRALTGSYSGGGTSAPATTGSSQPKLRSGDRGEAVRTLQSQLNSSGASLTVDGVFGRATNNAVRSLQSAAGIGVDGVVGPKTWNALAGSTTIGSGGGGSTSAPSSSQPKLRSGDRGEAVRTLQSQLNSSGASLTVDGVFGRATNNAVRSLQSAAGIGVDGVVGPKTWNALAGSTTISPGSSGGGGGNSSVGSSFNGQAIIDKARSVKGTRYKWGGHSPSTGFDCSGLVHYAYNQAGIDMPRKTAKGYTFGGKVIPKSQAQPGDLVAFTANDYGHIGIYIGDGKIIDASGSRQRVVERSIWNSPHVFVTYR